MRILIVDDERPLAEALAQILSEAQYQVDVVYDGEAALERAQEETYDVLILDVMLPKVDGFSVCRALRKEGSAASILMLTARDEVTDKVNGLDCGADDYMTKPFAPQELLARIRALTRRQGEVVLEELSYGDLRLGLFTRVLSCGNKSVHLGFKEFDVLRIMMLSPKTVISKEELLNKVWGEGSSAEDNNVEAYISFLRKKLYFLGSQVSIATVRKVGYFLEGSE